jgi:hypothetical protein
VHRPNSETHRKRAAGEPRKTQLPSRSGCASGKIERRVSGKNSDHHRQRDKADIV